MKIVHLIFSMEAGGGAEEMLVDIINEQSLKHDVRLVIVNRHYTSSLLERICNNISIEKINRKPGSRNLLKIILLWYRLFMNKPDIIHCHNIELVKLLPFWSNIIITLHTTGINLSKLSRKQYKRVKKVCCISSSVQRYLNKNFNFINSEKFCVVNNGIDFSRITRKKSNERINRLKIVQVGRLIHEIKGQDILIEAISLLHKNKIYAKVDFIGDGASLPYLQRLVRNHGLEKYVRFMGRKSRDYLYHRLCNYSLCVQPSRQEGFGLSIVEAIAAGIPVIASSIEGCAEIIEQTGAGVTFTVGDASCLADSIKNFYLGNFKLNMDHAYQRARKLYSIKNTASSYLSLYHEVLNENKNKSIY